ncbi:hypothetical protein [Pseudomonas aeruginosa]|uniref:hypothetical protein n=1 Tax=Pseudomonas aeruginosa TaxID=287 RepID=UPI0015812920|nr:hypothetical protein [Pseudomonas aeruginosa]QKR47648.1 hypothetical protein HB733_06615 [Pseudomonas aeruginosa]HEO1662766.1 hypothetical protein [Pseudomonas aeruginosa]
MSEVKRFDVPSMRSLTQGEQAVMGYEVVLASDYDALAAKLTMAEDAAAKGDAARQQCGGMEMEIEELRAELAELRARVVVVPERITPFPENIDKLDPVRCGWNACLDELARINGMTVSEGLLRRVCAEQPATCCMDDELSWRRHRDSALIELRALLNEDKENGNG